MKPLLGTVTALAVLYTVDGLLFDEKYTRAFMMLARQICRSMGLHL